MVCASRRNAREEPELEPLWSFVEGRDDLFIQRDQGIPHRRAGFPNALSSVHWIPPVGRRVTRRLAAPEHHDEHEKRGGALKVHWHPRRAMWLGVAHPHRPAVA